MGSGTVPPQSRGPRCESDGSGKDPPSCLLCIICSPRPALEPRRLHPPPGQAGGAVHTPWRSRTHSRASPSPAAAPHRSPEAAQRVQGQLKLIIRSIYSCPPRHGATIAATVMTDPLLCARWQVGQSQGDVRVCCESAHPAVSRRSTGRVLRRLGGCQGWWGLAAVDSATAIADGLVCITLTGCTVPEQGCTSHVFHSYMNGTFSWNVGHVGFDISCTLLQAAVVHHPLFRFFIKHDPS